MKEWFEKLLKNKKALLLIAAGLLVAVCLIAGICLLSADEAPVEASYTLTVQIQDGTAFADVGVYVYADAQQQDLVAFERTDEQGKITWKGYTQTVYTLVLNNLPEGVTAKESYVTQGLQTVITLSGSAKSTIELGDNVSDLQITAADGTLYSISQLLESKKAVVLNFWFANCNPCKHEMPFMQGAYEKYSDKLELLALNPIDTRDDTVQQVEAELDIAFTFPMFLCDASWNETMNLTAFPTTVVIDRFGTVSLIHIGSLPDQGVFERLFAFYTADTYTESVVAKRITDVIALEAGEGTQENPLVITGASKGGEITVSGDETVYCKLTGAADMVLTIENKNAYIIYNGQTVSEKNGTVTLPIFAQEAEDVLVQIGLKENAAQETLNVNLALRDGSKSKPITLQDDVFATQVLAGDFNGVHYTYKATGAGTFTVTAHTFPTKDAFDYVLTNVTAGKTVKLSENSGSEKSVSVAVAAGDEVLLTICMQEKDGAYPAGQFTSQFTLETEGETEPTQGADTPTESVQTKPSYNTTPTGEAKMAFPTESMEITVAPGQLDYYGFGRLEGKFIIVNHSDAYLVIRGDLYEPREGGQTVYVAPEGNMPNTNAITEVCFGNAGTQTITYTVSFALPNDFSNPYAMELDKEFTTNQSYGDDNGVYYSVTAPRDGVLTVKCNSATAGVVYNYTLQNKTDTTATLCQSYNAETDTCSDTVSITVKAGNVILLCIAAMTDANGNRSPSATFTSIAYME